MHLLALDATMAPTCTIIHVLLHARLTTILIWVHAPYASLNVWAALQADLPINALPAHLQLHTIIIR